MPGVDRIRNQHRVLPVLVAATARSHCGQEEEHGPLSVEESSDRDDGLLKSIGHLFLNLEKQCCCLQPPARHSTLRAAQFRMPSLSGCDLI